MTEHTELAIARLRPGPGHAHEEVEANQRARLFRAMIEILGREGFEALTVRGLCRAAGVSSENFYQRFDNVEDCVASGYAAIMERTLRHARAARDAADGREAGLRAALRSVASDAAADPDATSAALAGAYAAGPGMLLRVHRAGQAFERFAAEAIGEGAVPPEILTAIVAGVARVVRVRALDGRLEELASCVEPLVDWVLSVSHPRSVELPELGKGLLERSEHAGSVDVSRMAPPGGGDEVRARILAAVARLAAERSYWELTPATIRAEAAVSRREFTARFDGVADCFLAAAKGLLLEAVERSERKAASARSWEGAVYRAALALLFEIARRPVIAKLAFLDLFEAGPGGIRCRAGLIAFGARRLRAGAPDRADLGEVTAEATVAAAWMLVRRRLLAGGAASLPSLAPTVAYLILAPPDGAGSALDAIRAEQERLFGPLSLTVSRGTVTAPADECVPGAFDRHRGV